MNIKKDTISAHCKVSRRCGGCRSKNSVYAATLRAKQGYLIKVLSQFCRVEKIIPSPRPVHYRNKVQMAFGKGSGGITSGVYQASERRIIETDLCMLDDIRADEIIRTVRELCPRFDIRGYDMRTKKGFLRHVMVRVSRSTDEIMVVLVTSIGAFGQARSFTNELLRRHPEITTVVHNINDTDTPLFLGAESHVLYGDGYITDRLCGLEFRISPRSFYQVNCEGAELLYKLAGECAKTEKTDRVIDAYCGTGTIGLSVAASAEEVIGVEKNPDAVRDAEQNACRNGIENARFVCDDAGIFMKKMAEAGERADVVITDPPRAGCSREFLDSLITLAPKRVVYVSCNPDTLCRDLSYLTKNGYTAEYAQGVDMFPFTDHVECVVCLTRK